MSRWQFAVFAVLLAGADFPALPDGGSIVTSTDGGGWVTVDTGKIADWTMVIRCEGEQSTRYNLCTTSNCTATVHNQLLDFDTTERIPVRQGHRDKYRFLALATDDAGVPFCKVQVATPP